MVFENLLLFQIQLAILGLVAIFIAWTLRWPTEADIAWKSDYQGIYMHDWNGLFMNQIMRDTFPRVKSDYVLTGLMSSVSVPSLRANWSAIEDSNNNNSAPKSVDP